MPKTELDGLPVIEVPDSEEITVAVKPEDIQEGDEADPQQHPIAIACGGNVEWMMPACPNEKCLSGAAISGSDTARRSECPRAFNCLNVKNRTMRWIILVIVLAMIPLLTGYTVWPIYGLYRIASAVETRNSAALHELIDFPSFRVSLAQQISATHRKKLTDTSVDSSERPVTAGVAGTIADAMLAKITLNPDRLLDLLGKGWVSADPPPPSGLAAPFTANSLGSVWQTWLNSDYSGRNFYVAVPVDGPSDQRFRVRLRLVQWVWKLSGLDLPESTITHLTQELTRRN